MANVSGKNSFFRKDHEGLEDYCSVFTLVSEFEPNKFNLSLTFQYKKNVQFWKGISGSFEYIVELKVENF